jgi:hypothetical protein
MWNQWNEVFRKTLGPAERSLVSELLKRQYESVGPGPTRTMLEHLFGEIGDEDDLIAMIKKYAASGQMYDGPMARVVRTVSLREVPVSDAGICFQSKSLRF